MRGELNAVAFPVLSAAQLAEIAEFGTEQPTTAGQLLFEAGEASYDLFVLLEGRAEVARFDDPEAPVIADYGPGGFAGELNLLTGQRRSLGCRVTEAGRVLVIAEPEFRRLLGAKPVLAEIIFNALVARREILRSEDGGQAIRIVGSRYSPEAMSLRTFAEHSHLAYAWIDVEDVEQPDELLAGMGLGAQDIPAVIMPTETLRRPSAATFAEHLGLTFHPTPGYVFDLVVVGTGPAGLSAAVYGASEGLRTVALDAVAIGGQAGSSSRIENYAGFPNGISGGDLTGGPPCRRCGSAPSSTRPVKWPACGPRRAFTSSSCATAARSRRARSSSPRARCTGAWPWRSSSASRGPASTTRRPTSRRVCAAGRRCS